jgi:hypothetical protein
MQVCRTTSRDAGSRLGRNSCVHRYAALAGLLLVVTATTSAPAATPRTVIQHGVQIELPSGWRVSNWIWSDCTSPAQTLALVTGKHPVRSGGLLLILEDTFNPAESFRPRSTFRLAARPLTFEGCCDTPAAAGYAFTFRENGRDFDVFLWARERAVAKIAVAALNTIRVAER